MLPITANPTMNNSQTIEPARGFAAKFGNLALTLWCIATTFFPAAFATADADTAWVLEQSLAPFSASYAVGNDVLQAGKASVMLDKNGANEWVYTLTTEPMGLFKLAGKGRILETSTFAIVDQNNGPIIQPKSYKYRQDNEQKRAIDATFNWGQMQLYFSRGANNTQATLNADTLDRMSMTITLMNKLTTDFESFNLNVFDGGRIKQLQVVNEGTESLSTNLGELTTIRVKTHNLSSSRRETITWFAPALQNLPVQIEQKKDGKLVARLSVSEYTER